MIESEELFMLRCFELAIKGLANVSPNPMVGAVIVNNSKIIGEGYHEKFGGPHAEVNAINSVSNQDLLKNSTLYVNLEPCSHYGKTPPCVDLIIQKQIHKVVISNSDPNPIVAGTGIEKLRNAGVNVVTNCLSEQGKKVNKRFFKFHNDKRPYIFLKWAQTTDGFMDIQRHNPENKEKYWITNPELKQLVHKWRSEEDAILIGANTAINDNPKLNVREWKGKNPIRVILSKNEILNKDLNILDDSQTTIIFTSTNHKYEGNHTSTIYIPDSSNFLKTVLDYLYQTQVQSVIFEGGFEVINSFITLNIWDEAFVLVGNKTFQKGLKAPSIHSNPFSVKTISNDKIFHYINN